MSFPIHDPSETEEMFEEIGDVIRLHLGFCPPCFVLILTDGKQAQTLFAGDNPTEMTRLLVEGTQNHIRHKVVS